MRGEEERSRDREIERRERRQRRRLIVHRASSKSRSCRSNDQRDRSRRSMSSSFRKATRDVSKREEANPTQIPHPHPCRVDTGTLPQSAKSMEHAPSIIFMDEIDSIGSARMESGFGNGDNEVQRTMLELLNQLDRFEASNKIKVLKATNRIDILDQALLRPGRIDRKIEFQIPMKRWESNEISIRECKEEELVYMHS
ncbi:hypothetical protein HYC85_012094 [Camellia sinensis]|uniref:ATPase AAA-type core domain-containing protein n=1 Tax=Camellia sinensis TaxID=4442 RepID=A0A7J7HD04_CAMSI|nr:hypothetical protein HYC85_012094 [Camellia sinensis]